MSKRFTIEISDQLNAWLEKQAIAGHRSKNKQIEYLLELTKKLFGEQAPEVTEAGVSSSANYRYRR